VNLNKVMLIGYLTREPELRSLPSGLQVCSFSMATNQPYTKNGERVSEATFHEVVAFGKTGELVAEYMQKGSQLYVEGRLRNRSWEKDGQKYRRTEIVADRVQFGQKKGERELVEEQEEEFDNVTPF
jgi:single-strand DNA-binding protein